MKHYAEILFADGRKPILRRIRVDAEGDLFVMIDKIPRKLDWLRNSPNFICRTFWT